MHCESLQKTYVGNMDTRGQARAVYSMILKYLVNVQIVAPHNLLHWLSISGKKYGAFSFRDSSLLETTIATLQFHHEIATWLLPAKNHYF